MMHYHPDIQNIIYFHRIIRAVPALPAGYSGDSTMTRGAREGDMNGGGASEFHGQTEI
jgi:hypothetical protein